MAEGILCDLAEEKGVDVEISSAGTNNMHTGDHPDPRAIAEMKKRGHDISQFKARQFDASDFSVYDKIYVMDESNYENVMALATNDAEKKKVDLFLNIAHPGENRDVPDPYFGGDEGFGKTYEMLHQSAEVLISRLHERQG